MAQAVSKSWMPPAAFTPISGPTVSRISFTSATVAPPVEKPVEVVRQLVKNETKEVNRLYWWQKVLILLGCASLIDLIVQIYKLLKRK